MSKQEQNNETGTKIDAIKDMELDDLKEVFYNVLGRVLQNEATLKKIAKVSGDFHHCIEKELATIATLTAKLELKECEIDYLYTKVGQLEEDFKAFQRANNKGNSRSIEDSVESNPSSWDDNLHDSLG